MKTQIIMPEIVEKIIVTRELTAPELEQIAAQVVKLGAENMAAEIRKKSAMDGFKAEIGTRASTIAELTHTHERRNIDEMFECKGHLVEEDRVWMVHFIHPETQALVKKRRATADELQYGIEDAGVGGKIMQLDSKAGGS